MSNKFKLTTLVLALSLGLAACSSSGGGSSKQKEADARAAEQAALKEQQQKEAEEAKKFILSSNESTLGEVSAFNPLKEIESNGKSKLTNIYQIGENKEISHAEKIEKTTTSGRNTTRIEMNYETYAYSQENSVYGLTYGEGRIDYNDLNGVTAVYSGKSTLAPNKHIVGTASYKGSAYIAPQVGMLGADNTIKGDFNLDADFDKGLVEGSINWINPNLLDNNQKINLTETKINHKNGFIEFDGVATHNAISGSYEGRFMGEEAPEVAGSVNFSDGLRLKAAFGGSKTDFKEEQDNSKIDAYHFGLSILNENITGDIEYLEAITGLNGLGQMLEPNGYGREVDSGVINETLEGNGIKINANLSYNSYAYTQNDASYLLMAMNGYIDGKRVDEVVSAYGGLPTLASENKNLNGKATYEGSAFIGQKGSSTINDGKFSLTADFSKNDVSGNISWGKERIALNKGNIVTENNHLSFYGNATHNKVNGKYDGKFMGANANEVVGKASVGNLVSAFGGVKQ